MKGQVVYLDTSAIIKRYIKELGSDFVRNTYLKAYSGELILSYSLWNIGEVLGVFNRARNTGRLDSGTYNTVRKRFLLETRRMLRIGLAVVVPLKARIIMNSWELIEKHHIYEADAIQISSARNVNASKFLTGDEKLHEIAGKEGLESVYLK